MLGVLYMMSGVQCSLSACPPPSLLLEILLTQGGSGAGETGAGEALKQEHGQEKEQWQRQEQGQGQEQEQEQDGLQ